MLNIAQTFQEKRIPVDVLYLDIHYMDAYKIFTWNEERFPDPAGMVASLKKMGIHTTLIVDPGIKVEKGYKAYEEGLKQNVFLKYPDGTAYAGSVWPGLCHFPDFTKPSARKWWGDAFTVYTNAGVDGFWNDMNEPATWGQRFPSLVEFDFDGNGGTTREGRNVYGMQMSRATYEGARSLLNNRRPFVLTRAGFAGLQRYTAIWTGDNLATDDHMLLGVRLVNSLGLSGVANAGVDVGGFMGEASSALYARWMTIGAFTPFFRAHKSNNMKESEPWSYGEETEAIAKYYIQFRYRMMPYIYSSFHESSTSGMPVSRSLAIDHSNDSKIFDWKYQNQYMFGEAFLVAPLASNVTAGKVYLPAGDWYDLHSDAQFSGNAEIMVEAPIHKLPVFIKASSIIPAQSVVMNMDAKPSDTLFLHVYNGIESNTFMFYEDDGLSYDYEKNAFSKREITFDPASKTITVGAVSGSMQSAFKHIYITLHGFETDEFEVAGKRITAETTPQHVIFPSSVYRQELYHAHEDIVYTRRFVITNTTDEIKISYR